MSEPHLNRVAELYGVEMRLGPQDRYVPATTVVPGVRAEYLPSESRLQFHFFAAPAFPRDFGARLVQLTEGYPHAGCVVDYVHEVESWYLELSNLPMPPTMEFAERVLRKLALGA